MKTQFLKRKTGNPFILFGAEFPDAVLALTDIKEFAGNSKLSQRDATVIIEAVVYPSVERMETNPSDFIRKFQFQFTRDSFAVTEFRAGVTVSKVNENTNIEALNLIQNGVELAMFKYDVTYAGGKIFTDVGLQALLTLPSVTENATLGDEWEIVQL